MLLEKNRLFELQQSEDSSVVYRILYLDVNNAVTINVNDPHAQPVWYKRAELESVIVPGSILQEDPFEAILPRIEDLSEAQCKSLDIAWEAVKEICSSGELAFIPEKRGKLIAEVAKKLGRSEKAIRKDIRRFWQQGQTKLAIVARYDLRGGKGKDRTTLKENVEWTKKTERVQGWESKPDSQVYKRGRRSTRSVLTGETIGVNVDDAIKEAIVRGGRKAFKTAGMTYPRAYRLTLQSETCFHRGKKYKNGLIVPNLKAAEEIITLDQFKYWYKKERDRDFIKELIDRVGKRKYNLHHRAIGGDSTERAFGPGSIYQIDSTVADVYLRHSLKRKWLIGRPTLYLVIDLFTRMIVGFAVTMEPPSWLGVMLALYNTASNKVEFCKDFKVEITQDECPCECLPEQFVADHQEFDSYNANNLVDAFHIDVCLAPPFRADLKAIIERSFRWFNDEEIHWFLGASKKSIRERGEKDPRIDGVLTPDEFRKLMILCILDHNNERLL